MPLATGSLLAGRPIVEIELLEHSSRRKLHRTLLADTGAGALHSPFDLIIREMDQQRCAGRLYGFINLGGAIRGRFPLHSVVASIPAIGWRKSVVTVGVPASNLPQDVDGIAAFRFLSVFSYGNFGKASQCSLENP